MSSVVFLLLLISETGILESWRVRDLSRGEKIDDRTGRFHYRTSGKITV